ncbi:MAG: hypothetical protein CL912_28405 [Deltaproteobacteria bacterium]|nr:hypothetical protein [Deltaproteobacteria bacterium]
MRRDETGDRDKTVAFVAYVLYCGSRHGKGIEGGVWRKRVVFCCDFLLICAFVRSSSLDFCSSAFIVFCRLFLFLSFGNDFRFCFRVQKIRWEAEMRLSIYQTSRDMKFSFLFISVE